MPVAPRTASLTKRFLSRLSPRRGADCSCSSCVRQCRGACDRVLLDPDLPTLGHVTRQQWQGDAKWVTAEPQTCPPII